MNPVHSSRCSPHWPSSCLLLLRAQKTQLTVYTALETDQIKAYETGFNRVNPNIELKWVRDSTGVITAKLLAEKANPQADVLMGVAASSVALLDTNDAPAVRADQPRRDHGEYRDKKNPPGVVRHGRLGCDRLLQHLKYFRLILSNGPMILLLVLNLINTVS